LASIDAANLSPLGPQRLQSRHPRHGARIGARLGSSFAAEEAGDPDGKDPAEKDADGKEDPFPLWANTKGLPTVTLTSKSEKYFSPDIADAAGDGTFKPIFGCKCGDWQPAPTHPMIMFRDDYIKSHPQFTAQVRKLKVHMEDTTANKVHWDATYDLRRFLTVEERAKANQPGGSLKLIDTIPADKGTGQQIRFMSFCPPEPRPGDDMHSPEKAVPHEYLLKVTALNSDEQPIDGFVDDESRYSALPPEPEQGPGPESVPTAALAEQPVVATARASEG